MYRQFVFFLKKENNSVPSSWATVLVSRTASLSVHLPRHTKTHLQHFPNQWGLNPWPHTRQANNRFTTDLHPSCHTGLGCGSVVEYRLSLRKALLQSPGYQNLIKCYRTFFCYFFYLLSTASYITLVFDHTGYWNLSPQESHSFALYCSVARPGPGSDS